MSKPKPWYTDPTKIGGLIMLVITVGGMIVSAAVANARQDEKVRRIDETLRDQGDELEEQDKDLEQTQRQYDLIQQDVGYLKEGIKELLERKR